MSYLQEVVADLLKLYASVASWHALGPTHGVWQEEDGIALPPPVPLPTEGLPALHQDLPGGCQAGHARRQI